VAIEVVRLAVSTGCSAEEVCELADKLGVEQVLVEMNPADEAGAAILRAMKDRNARAIVFVQPQGREVGPELGTPALEGVDSGKLLRALKTGFGEAEAA
jgi:hypothetical protein